MDRGDYQALPQADEDGAVTLWETVWPHQNPPHAWEVTETFTSDEESGDSDDEDAGEGEAAAAAESADDASSVERPQRRRAAGVGGRRRLFHYATDPRTDRPTEGGVCDCFGPRYRPRGGFFLRANIATVS